VIVARDAVAAVAFVAAAATAVLVGSAPDGAVAADRCDGVRVVVDATAAGGPLTVRCADGDPRSGFAALEAVGHRYTFVPNIPGFVCTIDARPNPCNGAPADAYWSYWSASAGGSWVYNSRGAASRDPAPGEVEGWAFGAGAPPGIRPPSDPPPQPEPDPEPTPERAEPSPSTSGTTNGTSSGGSGPSDTTSEAPSAPAPPAPSASGTPPPSPDAGAVEPPDEPADDVDAPDETDETGDADQPDDPDVVDEAADLDETTDDAEVRDDTVAIDAPGGGRPGVGVLTGAAIVAAIGGGAYLQRRRRA
jgi:hypothetical protein